MKLTKDNTTLQTYNKVAERYYDRNKDRSSIDRQLEQFAKLVAEQGVAGLPVLDIGCGPGFDTARMREYGLSSIGLDLSWGMLRSGKLHFSNSCVLADMLRIPAGEVVGAVWSCASLLHLEREELPAALKEFARVIIKNGVLYLSLKKGTGHKWTDAPYGGSTRRYFTFWESLELDPLIEEAGFQIRQSSTEEFDGDSMWLTRFAVRI